MLKISDIIQIKIDKIVFGGEGLGYYNGFAVFVPMSIPEDELEIQIISVKKTYARGLIKNIIKASPERIDSHKFTFEDLYGCDFVMLKYESQLKYKKLMVEEVMRKIAGFSDIEISDVLASEDIYNYRNKIIEPFSVYANKIITGFFRRKSHEVFEVDENILNSKLGNRIIKELKEILNKNKISVYNEITHKGLLRNVMIRTNSNNEAMVVLIINSNKITENIKKLLFKLRENIEEIKSIYISLNSKKTNTVIGENNVFIYGEESIKENINGIEFHISPTSFFQINVKQAKRLYDIAISFFDNIDNKYIVDAYSGTGTIGMIMAKKAKKVYAIEIVKSASEDGEKTAKENGIENIEFLNGAVEKELVKLINANKRIDTIIFDPPRKGLDASIIDTVAELNLKEVVYISCNPSTFARDVKLFSEKGYILKKLQAVDMFPQTSHIECVGLMSQNLL
ncbi:23S rRNA (uracil(1939)-C(5))-methyltransferase RlmD [Fusobacterium nucleatum]|nr:23S rRNA (uracil(1939)-C(5))-methyltransferase RlmD [Fusobacterium nucleatum]WDF25199.1 23S rRNA (uracil(1939)-C(5))-methyltransferase RlmD [Fusobacterium nucleatum]